MARGYRRRSHMGQSSAAEGPVIAGRAQRDDADDAAHVVGGQHTPADSMASRNDQYGWQHEAGDCARTLGSI